MIRNATNIKLTIKPIFFSMEHKYYYEGPCRMAGGDALKPGFDAMVNGKIYKGFLAAIDANLDKSAFEVLDPVVTRSTDDWDNKEAWYEKMLEDDAVTDVYLINTGFGANTIIEEFCSRTKKTICVNPTKIFGPMSLAGPARNGADVVFAMDWPELIWRLKALRAEKIACRANYLCAVRFNGTKAMAGGTDSFSNLEELTRRWGTHFRWINIHELMDQMEPLPEGGNHTTPGRDTMNITAEDLVWCESLADQMMKGAKTCKIEKKFVVNSLKAYKVVQKYLDYYDCSAFTAPCPDACSTRRLNELQFTFCFTHSLNLENGIGSACEYDITSAFVMLLEMALAGKAAYMGNTLPLALNSDGTINWPDPKYAVDLDDVQNLYITTHSTPCRALHGFDSLDEYALRHFALDAGFGAIQRHEFNDDKGQIVTLCRISPDLKQMFIGRGEIVAGIGYDSDNCNGGFVFRVEDNRDFFHKHATFGLHLPIVYGDYTEQLAFIAQRLGLEPVFA